MILSLPSSDKLNFFDQVGAFTLSISFQKNCPAFFSRRGKTQRSHWKSFVLKNYALYSVNLNLIITSDADLKIVLAKKTKSFPFLPRGTSFSRANSLPDYRSKVSGFFFKMKLQTERYQRLVTDMFMSIARGFFFPAERKTKISVRSSFELVLQSVC